MKTKITTPYSYFWLGCWQFPLCTIFSNIFYENILIKIFELLPGRSATIQRQILELPADCYRIVGLLKRKHSSDSSLRYSGLTWINNCPLSVARALCRLWNVLYIQSCYPINYRIMGWNENLCCRGLSIARNRARIKNLLQTKQNKHQNLQRVCLIYLRFLCLFPRNDHLYQWRCAWELNIQLQI